MFFILSIYVNHSNACRTLLRRLSRFEQKENISARILLIFDQMLSNIAFYFINLLICFIICSETVFRNFGLHSKKTLMSTKKIWFKSSLFSPLLVSWPYRHLHQLKHQRRSPAWKANIWNCAQIPARSKICARDYQHSKQLTHSLREWLRQW